MGSVMEFIKSILHPSEHKQLVKAEQKFNETKEGLKNSLRQHGLDKAFDDMEKQLKRRPPQ